MDLLKELQKAKKDDVIYFRADDGAVHTCLVYGRDKTAVQIAAPEIRKHWEAVDDKRLSVVLQSGRPVFGS